MDHPEHFLRLKSKEFSLLQHLELKGSSIPTYQKLNAFMESAKPSVYAKSNKEGLERVRKEEGMYAFFMEAASIEYNVERFCDLRQLGGLLDSKGYGIALPKGKRIGKYLT